MLCLHSLAVKSIHRDSLREKQELFLYVKFQGARLSRVILLDLVLKSIQCEFYVYLGDNLLQFLHMVFHHALSK